VTDTRVSDVTSLSDLSRSVTSMAKNWRYPSLEDFLAASELTVDGQLEDGWGGEVFVKGREIEAVTLFADISDFSARTADMTPTETLVYVNTFFTWITEEALRHSVGVIDKYIGDEVMVVFAKEFGSTDPFVDAVRVARWICENDVLDYQPRIGVASGPVVVGYVGTPLRHNCSVFGASVALAARCAGVKAELPDNQFATHVITFPASDWGDRGHVDDVLEAQRRKGYDPSDPAAIVEIPASEKWSLTRPFDRDLKNVGIVALGQLSDPMSLRINQGWSAESRAVDGVQNLKSANRYWPGGR
jgi:class 3 adenylate cyclase